MIELSIYETTTNPQCSLGMVDAKPAYLDDNYWIDISLVPSSIGIREIVQRLRN